MKRSLLILFSFLFCTITTANAGTLCGLILDSSTNHSVNGAAVTVMNSTTDACSTIAENGCFSVTLPKGEYWLKVNAKDYLPHTSTGVTVPSTGSVVQDVYLTYHPPTGHLEGKISLPKTAKTSVEATVWLPSLGKPFVARKGKFKVEVPAGKQPLVICAFGYERFEKDVTIKNGKTTKLDVKLKEAVLEGIVTGTITDEKTGEALPARVKVLDAPIAAAEIYSGHYQLQLPVGTHRLEITTFGYARKIVDKVNIEYGSITNCDVTLKSIPSILVVDDDEGEKHELYFTKALADIGKEHCLVDLASTGPLELSDIVCYETVIWFTGDSTKNTLSKSDQKILGEYIKCGGSLYLNGRNVASELKDSKFLKETLGCTFAKKSNGFKHLKGTLGQYRIKITHNPDALTCLPKSKELLSYAGYGFSDGSAALKNGKVVFSGFGFEKVIARDKRNALLKNILEQLKPSTRENHVRIELFEKPEQRQRWSQILYERYSELSDSELHVLSEEIENPSARRIVTAIRASRFNLCHLR